MGIAFTLVVFTVCTLVAVGALVAFDNNSFWDDKQDLTGKPRKKEKHLP
jgi:hypothetical protein